MIITDIPYIKLWRGDAQGSAFLFTFTHVATQVVVMLEAEDTTPESPLMALMLPSLRWEAMPDGEYRYTIKESESGKVIDKGIMIKSGVRAQDVEYKEANTYVEYKK